MDKQRELWKQEQNMHVWPSDGAAATWQIPDEANGFGIVGLRLFNLIPPFDDCMLLFFFSWRPGKWFSAEFTQKAKVSFYIGVMGWTLLQKLLVTILRLSARHLHLCFLSVRALRLILQKVKKKKNIFRNKICYKTTRTHRAKKRLDGRKEIFHSSQVKHHRIWWRETERDGALWCFFTGFEEPAHRKAQCTGQGWNHAQKTWARPVTARKLR